MYIKLQTDISLLKKFILGLHRFSPPLSMMGVSYPFSKICVLPCIIIVVRSNYKIK